MKPHVLMGVLRYIDEALHEPLPVLELAQRAGLSPFHFARSFRAATGETPHACIRRKRMEKAAAMLAETDLPIVQIAHRIGYRRQAHFTTIFRLHHGTTPKAYRDSHRAAAVVLAEAQDRVTA